jgi:hypothetical protein
MLTTFFVRISFHHISRFNIGHPHEVSVLELAELILDLTGSRSKIIYLPMPEDDPPRRRPDISEAERVLNWRPTVGLREGLEMTIAYFSKTLPESYSALVAANNGYDLALPIGDAQFVPEAASEATAAGRLHEQEG